MKKAVLIGKCPEIISIVSAADRLCQSKCPILITGETGTGKSHLAYYLHQQNGSNPLMSVIDCCDSSVLDSLAALRQKADKKQSEKHHADSNQSCQTILFDKIDEADINLQANILSFIDNVCHADLYKDYEQGQDYWFISTCSQNLIKLESMKKFRADLLYRINAMEITLPPLRVRGEDLLILACYFMGVINKKLGTSVSEIDDNVKLAMHAYPWPGNIRELFSVIEYMAIMRKSGLIILDDLSTTLRCSHEESIVASSQYNIPSSIINADQIDFKKLVDNFERKLLLTALNKFRWNKNRAAEFLSMNRTTLFEKIKSKRLNKADG